VSANIELIIMPREKDLGGFQVRRILPCATHRMVGPFIFFDHMGPAQFASGHAMDVRPHPHIGLATVTYLFEGAILHRDSLGSVQLIEPGAINWMTAGRGIVHSERTPEEAGSPVGNRFIWWNLVASTQEKIERAKDGWKMGPQKEHGPFRTIPGDDKEFIPLPKEPPVNPKGTIL
jgi:redox-sensitive bicupin YhaK (pirin superfamily)